MNKNNKQENEEQEQGHIEKKFKSTKKQTYSKGLYPINEEDQKKFYLANLWSEVYFLTDIYINWLFYLGYTAKGISA